MTPYWILLIVASAISLFAQKPLVSARAHPRAGWVMVWVVLTLMIGFRYEVGADWFAYMEQYLATSRTFAEAITETDPGYAALNWVSWNYGWGVYGVNIICGALFGFGLIAFCRVQPWPWLALAVATPYLVNVVAMGYSRQGVAIGLAMAALASLARGNTVRFVLWVSAAALFHKTAVILVPLAILAATRHRWWTALWVGTASALLYFLLLEDATDRFVSSYIDLEQQSEGAAVRVFMNAVPAAIFLLFRQRLVPDPVQRRLWTIFAIVALGFVPLLEISPSSTAVDRVALYWIPLQLFVLSRLPVLTPTEQKRTALAVVLSSATVQFVWLNYAIHAQYWVPYRSYLFVS